ncbi:MAG TPA: YqiA/YcfP family alpha/beta fold hydrolase [Candidatus Obscuribacterales bacterium]
MRCLYLHGFASGPRSQKALFFAARLRNQGFAVHVPDLNEPDFADLTLTRQLDHAQRIAEQISSDEPLLVLGSSMGGLVATLLCERLSNVGGLILLAPGFGINKRWESMPGTDELSKWQQKGFHEVFHYQTQSDRPLKYAFVQDMNQYRTDGLHVSVPTLVFHGKRDEVIPVEESRKFFRDNSEFVEYHELDSDHDLIDVLDDMWAQVDRFVARHTVVSLANAR